MSRKGPDRQGRVPPRARRAGRPRIHNIEAYIGILRYVADQQKRTGLPLNKILKYGVFVQAMSGSPESCADGPGRATVLHVIRGANLRRRYFEAAAWLERCTDSRDQPRAEPDWVTGWIILKR